MKVSVRLNVQLYFFNDIRATNVVSLHRGLITLYQHPALMSPLTCPANMAI